ncbi:MAG: hypothetical protein AMJ60_07365, partial [Desulfobacterales bacterium SG8_35]
MKSNHFKKVFISALAVIAVLFLAGLITTPYIIDLGLERWIASQGPEIGRIDNIDFNPFSGRLSMDNLLVETRSGRTLTVGHAELEFSWNQLFKKQLYLKELVLRDSFMLIDQLEERGLRVGGLILQELAGTGAKSDTPGWEVGIESFILQNAQIEYNTPELTATYFIDQYTLSGLETWNKQKAVKMAFQGRINESPVQVDAEVIPFDVVKSWKGTIVLEKGPLELISRVRGLQEFAPSGTIDIDLQLDAQRQENGTISINADGNIGLNKVQLRYGDYGLGQEQIAWKGGITGSQTAEKGFVLAVDGQLTGKDFAVNDSASSLQLILGIFDWQGKAGVRQQEDSLAVTMEAELDGAEIHVNDQQNKVGLLSLEKFNLAGIQIEGLDDMQILQVDLQNMRLAEKESGADKEAKESVAALVQIGAVEVSNTSLESGKNLSIGAAKIQDFEAFLLRDKSGKWQLMPVLPDSQQEAAAEQTQTAAAEAPGETGTFRLRLGNLKAGGENSVRFADEALPRPFRTTFHITELQLADLDTAEADTPARFKMEGRVGDYGSVAFDGTLNPSEKPITLDMKGVISALDMHPFTSYTGRAIGYNVTSGQMDADITMQIDSGKMDGNFALKMRRLEVAQVDPAKEPEIDTQMDVPLGTALSMLRNKKDEINLDLKLQGDIENPEFGIQDAINQALAKAMQVAAVSYLKYTLQPFGTYIAIAQVVGKAGKEMTKIGLDPVTFPAGEIVLDENAAQYLAKVKEVLNNRPKLRIELCGKGVEKDRAAILERRQAARKIEEEKAGLKQEAAVEEMAVSDEIL